MARFKKAFRDIGGLMPQLKLKPFRRKKRKRLEKFARSIARLPKRKLPIQLQRLNQIRQSQARQQSQVLTSSGDGFNAISQSLQRVPDRYLQQRILQEQKQSYRRRISSPKYKDFIRRRRQAFERSIQGSHNILNARQSQFRLDFVGEKEDDILKARNVFASGENILKPKSPYNILTPMENNILTEREDSINLLRRRRKNG